MARAHWRLKGSCAFDYLLVESTAISEPLHASESRFGPADGPHLSAPSCAPQEFDPENIGGLEDGGGEPIAAG